MTLPTLRYQPPDDDPAGIIVLAVGTVLVVMGNESADQVGGMWEAIQDEPSLDRAVEYAMGIGLRSLPRLVIAQVAPGERVDMIMRGNLVVDCVHADGTTEQFTAEHVRTWRELTVALQSLHLADRSNRESWPLIAGVAAASGLRWELFAEAKHEREVESQHVHPDGPSSLEVGQDPVEVEEIALSPSLAFRNAALHPEGPPTRPEGVRAPDNSAESWAEESPRAKVEDPPMEVDDPPMEVVVDDVADAPAEKGHLIGSVPINAVPSAAPASGHHSLPLPGHVSDEDPLEPSVEEDEFDQLFGITRQRSVEDAAVRPASDQVSTHEASADTAASATDGAIDTNGGLGDRDGLTMSSEELRALVSKQQSQETGAVGKPPEPGGVMIRALVCQHGHPNPPHEVRCRRCGASLVECRIQNIPAVSPGVLIFADGRREVLDGPLVIGRKPRETGVTGQVPPRLISVASPEGTVSRSHIAVRVEGWSVTVTDLSSGNGTEVSLPGEQPQRLRGGQQFIIVPGTTIMLADEVRLTYQIDE